MTGENNPRARPGRLGWAWPAVLLIGGWAWAPLRARGEYPGLPCTAGTATFLEQAGYLLTFVPVALLLIGITIVFRRARRAGRRGWTFALGAAAAAVAVGYLVFGGLSALPRSEQAVTCPALGGGLQALHCWQQQTPTQIFEMNALGRRPQSPDALVTMGQALARVKRDEFLDEAFVYDTKEPSVVDYSNGRLFILQRASLSFRDQCLFERVALVHTNQQHRIGFYRYSLQQSPPVDAFFLQDVATSGELQFEVLDFRHNRLLAYVAPPDMSAAESTYLDRVAFGLTQLNRDLDREAQVPTPPGALTTMRHDFTTIATQLVDVPPRLRAYRDSRLKRFLENFDLLLVSEETASQGSNGQAIHSSAFEQHRRYYFQEPQVTRLIGYLYLQQPGQSFTDDELSTVNWAVF